MAFNTTPKHGKLARIEKNDVKMEFSDGWNIDVKLDMASKDRQGQQWGEGEPGQGHWSGSFSGQFVAGNTEQKAFMDNIVTATPGTKLTDVKFLLDADANAYTGDIYITGMAISAGVGDIIKVMFNFDGEGAPTLTDAA